MPNIPTDVFEWEILKESIVRDVKANGLLKTHNALVSRGFSQEIAGQLVSAALGNEPPPSLAANQKIEDSPGWPAMRQNIYRAIGQGKSFGHIVELLVQRGFDRDFAWKLANQALNEIGKPTDTKAIPESPDYFRNLLRIGIGVCVVSGLLTAWVYFTVPPSESNYVVSVVIALIGVVIAFIGWRGKKQQK